MSDNKKTKLVNRCKRCNRPLKNPDADYGWWCAQIVNATNPLNTNSSNTITYALIQLAYHEYLSEITKGSRQKFYPQTTKNLLLDSFVKLELARHENQKDVMQEAQKDISKILEVADQNPNADLSYQITKEDEFIPFSGQNLSKTLENSPTMVYNDNSVLHWQSDRFYAEAKADVTLFLDNLIEQNGIYQRYSFLEQTAQNSDYLSSRAVFLDQEYLVDTVKLMAAAADVYMDVSTLGVSAKTKLLLATAAAPLYAQDDTPMPGLGYATNFAIDSMIDYSNTKSFEKMAEYVFILDSKYRYLMDPNRVTTDTSDRFASACVEKMRECNKALKKETDPGNKQYLTYVIDMLQEIADMNRNPQRTVREFRQETKALIEQTRRQIQTPEGKHLVREVFNNERNK